MTRSTPSISRLAVLLLLQLVVVSAAHGHGPVHVGSGTGVASVAASSGGANHGALHAPVLCELCRAAETSERSVASRAVVAPEALAPRSDLAPQREARAPASPASIRQRPRAPPIHG